MNDQNTISKITLGTVQLGISYGIANKSGKPTGQNSHRLLKFALQNGIQSLDTARIYGNAEEVIGSFENAKNFTVVSKFKLGDAALQDPDLAIQEARKSVQLSCEALKIKKVAIYLFHKDKDQKMEEVSRILPSVIKTLKAEGLIAEGGISVFAPEELNDIYNWENISAVQVPLNVFDSRILQGNLMDTLVKNNVKVFARSIYLQGLLLMSEAEIPSYLSSAKHYVSILTKIAF